MNWGGKFSLINNEQQINRKYRQVHCSSKKIVLVIVPGEIRFNLCRTVVHPYYDPSTISNDIALVELCQVSIFIACPSLILMT